MYSNLKRNKGRELISEILLKFTLIDALFFPYPPGIPITFGGMAAIIWLPLVFKSVKPKYIIISAILIILTVLSFLRFLAFSAPDEGIYLTANLMNAGIVCLMAILIMLIVTTVEQTRSLPKIEIFLISAFKVYIIFKSILAALFFTNPDQYFSIRSFWTFYGNEIVIGKLNVTTRFTGTLSDPNNFACIMVAVVAFVIFRQPEKLFQNLAILLISSAWVVASMSVTGGIAFLVISIIYILFADLPGQALMRKVLRATLLFLVPLSCLAIFSAVQENTVVQLALQRIFESSSDSRVGKFLILLDADKLFSSLFIGEGSTIIWNGEVFQPHIGHIYILLSCGLPAYIVFLRAFFPISLIKPFSQSIFFLPIFLGFTVNVGIYEPRFGTIWAILAGIYYLELPRVKKLQHNLRLQSVNLNVNMRKTLQ